MRCSICHKEFGNGERCQHCGSNIGNLQVSFMSHSANFEFSSRVNCRELEDKVNYNYVEKIWEDEEAVYYRLRLEKGENSINTYDPYSMEFGEKQKKINRGTRYLIFNSRMREFRIVDKYGKLPKDIISHSLGASSYDDLEDGVNWLSRAKDLFYEYEGFEFQNPITVEWEWDDFGNYHAEEVVDQEIQEKNLKEESKLRLYQVASGSSSYRIYYGFKYEGGTLEDCVSAGRLVLFKLSGGHNTHYVNAIEDFPCAEYYIEVDKKIKSYYPDMNVEPISFSYKNIYYCIHDQNKDHYVRFGMDDQIYPLKREETIAWVAKRKKSLSQQSLIETIKNYCLKEFDYKIGGKDRD